MKLTYLANPILALALAVLTACQSTAPVTQAQTEAADREMAAAPAGAYSQAHLDFAKWKRNPETCCVATGTKMAVASGGELSSKAGLEVAEAGGNIVDAAVATAFAMAVERVYSMGIGGGGFMTLHLTGPKGGDFFVDFRETAPRKAKKTMYLDKKGEVVPGLSTEGGLAVATPGFVAGMFEIHRKWGRLKWNRVLAPAIRLAREGFPAYVQLADKVAAKREKIAKNAYFKSLVFDKHGEPIQEGAKFVQTDLSNTLEKIAIEGKSAFYAGELARQIAKAVKEAKGVMDAADLAAYQVKHRKPILGTYKEYKYITAPAPSAGGVILAETLNVLSPLSLDEETRDPVRYSHLLSEVFKRGYADRSEVIGDPDFFKSDYSYLLSPSYADGIRKEINRDKATPSSEVRPGRRPNQETHGTSHLSIIDDKGNAISSTLTINTGFGALLPVPGTGIFLNNEMDDFSAKTGEKNVYGLTGNDANAIAPGKRPVSSMMPTIVIKDGQPVLAVGAMGGSRIITSTIQVILNQLAVYPGDLRKSVFAPRIHHQWLPDKLDLEGGFFDADVDRFTAMGHKTGPWDWLAEVEAVARDADGKLTAVFDPRGPGGVAAQ